MFTYVFSTFRGDKWDDGEKKSLDRDNAGERRERSRTLSEDSDKRTDVTTSNFLTILNVICRMAVAGIIPIVEASCRLDFKSSKAPVLLDRTRLINPPCALALACRGVHIRQTREIRARGLCRGCMEEHKWICHQVATKHHDLKSFAFIGWDGPVRRGMPPPPYYDQFGPAGYEREYNR